MNCLFGDALANFAQKMDPNKIAGRGTICAGGVQCAIVALPVPQGAKVQKRLSNFSKFCKCPKMGYKDMGTEGPKQREGGIHVEEGRSWGTTFTQGSEPLGQEGRATPIGGHTTVL